jgi:anti-sigma factor ChrR (cupin superfamily)
MLDPGLREIIATQGADFLPYDRYGDPLPGMSWLPLSGEPQNGEFECFLLRMEAGASSRPHEHTGFEEFLVMDGELIDCDGSRYGPGDYLRFLPGSKHSSSTPDGCTLLVMLRGNNRALDEDEITPSTSI